MGEHQFYDYSVEHNDKESQHSQKLSEVEELILKPHREEGGIANLTEEELKLYLNIDIEDLNKKKINIKTILVCKATQEFIKENMDSILKVIKKQKEQGENENER